MYTILSKYYDVRRSKKSFNGSLGLPLSILDLNNGFRNPFKWVWNLSLGVVRIFFPVDKKDTILILEIGVDRVGDVRKACRLVDPEIVVFTILPEVPVHIGNFKKREHLYNEKLSILKYIKERGAFIYINKGEILNHLQPHRTDILFRSCGESKESDFVLGEVKTLAVDHCKMAVEVNISEGNNSKKFTIENAFGDHMPELMNISLCAAKILDVDIFNESNVFSGYLPEPGRMNMHTGISGFCIIDDSYNSSPVAVKSAIASMEKMEVKGKRVLVLGEMAELGIFSEKSHMEQVQLAVDKCDLLLLMGDENKKVYENLKINEGKVKHFDIHDDLILFLKVNLRRDDLVLIKGSQSARMEKIVESIIDPKSESDKILSRQESFWKSK